MSSEYIIDGKTYISATRAGKHFDYTKDYILLLVKEGKIDGKLIKHKWHVHLPSAEKYFNDAKEKREGRRLKISEERKDELKQHAKSRTSNDYRVALVETLVIVVIGLSLGAAGYLGTTGTYTANATSSNVSFFENIARNIYSFFGGNTETFTDTNTSMQGASVSTRIGTTTVTSFVVAPDELFTSTTIDSIRDSFSDQVEVTIDPNNPDTGIITPEFKEGKGEPYRFLMVPVTAETQ